MGTKATRKNHFAETARELGLDTDEANEAFERAFGKIAPPKKKSDVTEKERSERLNKKD